MSSSKYVVPLYQILSRNSKFEAVNYITSVYCIYPNLGPDIYFFLTLYIESENKIM